MDVAKIFATLLARMPAAQREAYLAQLPKKDTSEGAIVLPQVGAAVQIPHLPERAGPSQAFSLRSIAVTSVTDPRLVKRDQLATEALRAAFGDQIPHVDV